MLVSEGQTLPFYGKQSLLWNVVNANLLIIKKGGHQSIFNNGGKKKAEFCKDVLWYSWLYVVSSHRKVSRGPLCKEYYIVCCTEKNSLWQYTSCAVKIYCTFLNNGHYRAWRELYDEKISFFKPRLMQRYRSSVYMSNF